MVLGAIGYSEVSIGLFNHVSNEKTRGNGFKLCQGISEKENHLQSG